VTWVDVNDPPLFLAHGTSDTSVPTNQSTRLSAVLFSAGVVHELRDLPGIGHGFGGGAIDVAAVAFLKEHLVGPTRPVVGTAFCFGDGSGTACPCGNASFSGARLGCKNAFVVGASLTAVGVASVSNDTLILRGDAMPNGGVLYFQGSLRQSAGSGSLFGDGLLCVTGTVTRLAVKSTCPAPRSTPSPDCRASRHSVPRLRARRSTTRFGTATRTRSARRLSSTCLTVCPLRGPSEMDVADDLR